MKKLLTLLAFSTVFSIGVAAKAADMVEAPLVYDWTGFYIGANIGYAFAGNGDEVGVRSNQFGHDSFGDLDVSGIFGGAQIGADWQASWAVFGLVADVQVADINDDFDNRGGHDFNFLSTDASNDINWWGTVRGRLGWAFDRVLIYGTGGLAWANVDYKVFTQNTLSGVNAHIDDDYLRLVGRLAAVSPGRSMTIGQQAPRSSMSISEKIPSKAKPTTSKVRVRSLRHTQLRIFGRPGSM